MNKQYIISVFILLVSMRLCYSQTTYNILTDNPPSLSYCTGAPLTITFTDESVTGNTHTPYVLTYVSGNISVDITDGVNTYTGINLQVNLNSQPYSVSFEIPSNAVYNSVYHFSVIATGCTETSSGNAVSPSFISNGSDLTINDLPVINVSCSNQYFTSCNGASVLLTANVTQTAPNQVYSYTWAPAHNLPQISGGAGNYSVTVTDNLGCTGTGNATVQADQPLAAHAASTASVNLDPNNSALTFGTTGAHPTADGGTAPYTYTWTTASNITSYLSSTTDPNPMLDFNYLDVNDVVQVEVKDAYDCVVSDQVNLNVTKIKLDVKHVLTSSFDMNFPGIATTLFNNATVQSGTSSNVYFLAPTYTGGGNNLVELHIQPGTNAPVDELWIRFPYNNSWDIVNPVEIKTATGNSWETLSQEFYDYSGNEISFVNYKLPPSGDLRILTNLQNGVLLPVASNDFNITLSDPARWSDFTSWSLLIKDEAGIQAFNNTWTSTASPVSCPSTALGTGMYTFEFTLNGQGTNGPIIKAFKSKFIRN